MLISVWRKRFGWNRIALVLPRSAVASIPSPHILKWCPSNSR